MSAWSAWSARLSGEATNVYLPLVEAQTLSGNAGKITTIYVKATSANDVSAAQGEIQAALTGTTVKTTSDLADQVSGSLSSAAGLARNLGTWLSVAVLIAAFTMAALFTISSVSRRVREFGTLKALGTAAASSGRRSANPWLKAWPVAWPASDWATSAPTWWPHSRRHLPPRWPPPVSRPAERVAAARVVAAVPGASPVARAGRCATRPRRSRCTSPRRSRSPRLRWVSGWPSPGASSRAGSAAGGRPGCDQPMPCAASSSPGTRPLANIEIEETSVYELSGVTKRYQTKRGSVTALNGIDLRIDDGELLAIQGPTGHGKSTLLQMLGGLDRPTSGEVHFDGQPLERLTERRMTDLRARQFGFVFQTFNLVQTLSAAENVEAALVPLGVRADERRQRAATALTEVGLGDRLHHVPSELSGGEQQRVAIARALVKQPKVILADEPTGNLDEGTRDEIIAIIEALWRERGLTVIMVTHDSVIARRAPKIAWISMGKLKIRAGRGV